VLFLFRSLLSILYWLGSPDIILRYCVRAVLSVASICVPLSVLIRI
jgi:hypothetical protein